MSAVWADPHELERRLREKLPAVRVVPERHVRKALAHLTDNSADPLQPVWVNAADIADIIPLRDPTGEVVLLAAADDRMPGVRDEAAVLRQCWRLLVRASVWKSARTPAALPADFLAEARFVLEADHVSPPDSTDTILVAALAATCADVMSFAPDRLPDIFPSAPPADEVRLLLFPNVDLPKLVEALKPAGAGDATAESPTDQPPITADPDEATAAADAKARGNFVRAAVRCVRAAAVCNPVDRERYLRRSESYLRQGVVNPLGKACGWATDQEEAWFRALVPLLTPAATGTWPPAAKALYDLQKLAADLAGELRVVTPVEYALSFGKHPASRSLADVKDVIRHRGLTRVSKHLDRVPLAPRDRELLDELLDDDRTATEARVRGDLGPRIHKALDVAALIETNLPERVARGKIVGELLDRVADTGFLRLGDLRDAVARNQLKLPDLSGPGEWVRGDPLLRADRELADSLFGVYHRGEIYLRMIQRASAAAFGTTAGRLLTLFVLLPFGGAFVALEGLQHLLHMLQDGWAWVAGRLVPEAGESHPAHVHLATWPGVVGLGLFLLALLNVPTFRRRVFAAVGAVASGCRSVLVDGPAYVWQLPVVRAVRQHPAIRSAVLHFGFPLTTAAVVAVVLTAAGASLAQIGVWSGVVFATLAVVGNLPLGRRVIESAAETLSDTWRAVRTNLVPGLVGWVLWVFRELLAAVDRFVYAVDEKFRYRAGASRPSVVVRNVLAVVWFPVGYVVRFVFYLLFEPQVNPVKHFPVVTVSHKLILPLSGAIADAVGSKAIAGVIVTGCPGIFGFLAWELMANWRLYAANRPARLGPVPVGHHGESVRGLLRLGFHSGTVPRLFRKLRTGWLTGGRPTVRQEQSARHDLHHVEVAVRRLIVRDVFAYWAAAPATAGLKCRVGHVVPTVQRLTVEIVRDESDEPPLRIAFACRDRTVMAETADRGFVDALPPAAREVIDATVSGLFAAAGADDPPPADVAEYERWLTFWKVRG